MREEAIFLGLMVQQVLQFWRHQEHLCGLTDVISCKPEPKWMKIGLWWKKANQVIETFNQAHPLFESNIFTGTLTRGDWIANNLKSGSHVGVDPFLISVSEWNKIKKSAQSNGIELVEVTNNLVDTIWGPEQPGQPNKPIVPLEIKFTGKSWEDKVKEMREEMKAKKADSLVLSALDDVAWLLVRMKWITYYKLKQNNCLKVVKFILQCIRDGAFSALKSINLFYQDWNFIITHNNYALILSKILTKSYVKLTHWKIFLFHFPLPATIWFDKVNKWDVVQNLLLKRFHFTQGVWYSIHFLDWCLLKGETKRSLVYLHLEVKSPSRLHYNFSN